MSTDTKTTKVRIYKPHTHKGQRIVPPTDGADIEVTEKQLAFLKARGITDKPVAEVVTASAKPAVAISTDSKIA